jgi:hypothetical protein
MPGTGGGAGGANVLGYAVAAYNIFGGMVNTSKANAEGNYLERTKPVKKTSQFDRDALALTESDLANGMSAEAEAAYEDSTERSLSTQISAILKSGGGANNIGDLYGNDAAGRSQMAIIRENLRLKKVDEYLKQLDNMASEEEKNWLVNEYGPYINKLKAVGEAKKAAAEQTAKGLDSVGGMGGGGGGLGSLFGGGKTSGRPETSVGSDGGIYPNYPSDRRLKNNIFKIGKSPSGINIYAFSYRGSSTRWQGALADEVPYASIVGPDGYKWLDYSLIDVEFKQI